MSKAVKTRKPLSAKTKGAVCLAVLLALLIFVSCIAIGGMKLDAAGVNILLPWVPVSSENWPQSLPLTRTLGGSASVDYAVTLPEGGDMNAVVDTINARLDGMGETDRSVTVVDDKTIRIELREMDHDRMHSVLSMAVMPGSFEFTDSNGAVLLTGEQIDKVQLGYNSTGTSYVMTLTVDEEAKAALTDVSLLSLYCDGSVVTSYALVSGDQITVTISDYNSVSNIAFLLNTGAINATLTEGQESESEGSSQGALTVVLIAGAVLLAAALVYAVIKGRLTGIAAFLTVWCAVLLMFFFVATIVLQSVPALNVGCLIAILLSMLLAIYTAVTRTDAISKLIGDGYGPKQATKLGLRTCGRQVWLVHGAALVISLVLMIFGFSKAVGYTLCAGVVSSAIVACLMRAFQGCFAALCQKSALFGKVK